VFLLHSMVFGLCLCLNFLIAFLLGLHDHGDRINHAKKVEATPRTWDGVVLHSFFEISYEIYTCAGCEGMALGRGRSSGLERGVLSVYGHGGYE